MGRQPKAKAKAASGGRGGPAQSNAGMQPNAKRARTAPVLFPASSARPLLSAHPMSSSLRFNIVDVSEASRASGTDVWLHGVTMTGQSVAVRVQDFRSYLYCTVPPVDQQICDEGLCATLASRLMKSPAAKIEGVSAASELIVAAERMQRRSLMHYQPQAGSFLRIEFVSPKLLPAAAKELERGFPIPRPAGAEPYEYQSPVFEAIVPFVLRFMVDTGLVGGGWVEFPAGSFTLVDGPARQTRAQIEAHAHRKDVQPLRAEGELMALAPLRILVLDVRADTDGSVGSVAAVLAVLGQREPVAKAAWVRPKKQVDGPQDTSIPAGDFHSCSDERDLLESVQAFVTHTDPDIIAGYEMLERIMPLILLRATATKAAGISMEYGRFHKAQSKVKIGQGGPQGEQRKEVTCEGRLLFDISHLIEKDHRLTSYALPFVVHHFLDTTHFDMQASRVAELLEQAPRHLAHHCLQDAAATWALLEKLCFTYNLFEMARVTGVPIDFLLTRGQMIKVTSQLLRKAREHGFLLPARGSTGEENTYEGGFVMEPRTGLYKNPIVVLDFASLYPSIMMAHNLCYTTLLPEGAERSLSLDADKVTETPATSPTLGSHYKFVKSNLQPGLLPLILKELLTKRKEAKKEMEKATDPMMRSVLHGRQLALKVSANSVYGFTGATNGNMPCLEIAASVTAYGREMITSTAAFIEETRQDTSVIYGDTDSVMLHFGPISREEAIQRGKAVAEKATQRFQEPIRLEFEKVLQPYLLLNKKRYAGRPWKGENQQPLDMKGIETVRRDWCGLVRQVCEHVLGLLLRPEPSIEGAIEYVRSIFGDLRRGAIDLRLLVISKALGKKGEADYVAKSAHVVLAEKLKKRNENTAPRPGDRVPYLVVAGAPDAKLWEKAEDPRYAQDNGLPTDADYYIEQQLLPPLLRILEPAYGSIGKDPIEVKGKLLASGGQARKTTSAPSAAKPKGIGGFFKKSVKCLGCGTALQSDAPFCKACSGTKKEEETRVSKERDGRDVRQRHQELRAKCIACIGPALGDAYKHCSNADCPIFFERAYVATSLEEAEATFKRLSLDW